MRPSEQNVVRNIKGIARIPQKMRDQLDGLCDYKPGEKIEHVPCLVRISFEARMEEVSKEAIDNQRGGLERSDINRIAGPPMYPTTISETAPSDHTQPLEPSMRKIITGRTYLHQYFSCRITLRLPLQ